MDGVVSSTSPGCKNTALPEVFIKKVEADYLRRAKLPKEVGEVVLRREGLSEQERNRKEAWSKTYNMVFTLQSKHTFHFLFQDHWPGSAVGLPCSWELPASSRVPLILQLDTLVHLHHTLFSGDSLSSLRKPSTLNSLPPVLHNWTSTVSLPIS